MKRYPNPWVFGPAAIGLAIGGWLGYFIAELSGTGTAAAVALAVLAGLSAAVGVGIVAVLALRSFDEWRTAEEQGLPAPGVGCEAPEPD
jgi:hypothetical protein